MRGLSSFVSVRWPWQTLQMCLRLYEEKKWAVQFKGLTHERSLRTPHKAPPCPFDLRRMTSCYYLALRIRCQGRSGSKEKKERCGLASEGGSRQERSEDKRNASHPQGPTRHRERRFSGCRALPLQFPVPSGYLLGHAMQREKQDRAFSFVRSNALPFATGEK